MMSLGPCDQVSALILSRFGNEWSRLVRGVQMCQHSHHRRLRGSTWCTSQPATGLFYVGFTSHHQAVWCVFLMHCVFLLLLLNFGCIDISLQTLSPVLLQACCLQASWVRFHRPSTPELRDSANLLCKSPKSPSGWRGTVGWPVSGLCWVGHSRTRL